MTIAGNVNEGVKLKQTATGRVLKAVPVVGTSMYRITYDDGKPGSIPDKYSGRYTAEHYAEAAIVNFIRDTWEVAAEHSKKRG